MEDLRELLLLLEREYPIKDKKGRPTGNDAMIFTIGDLKELLRKLLSDEKDYT